jgi:hypothetical protein
MTRRIFSREPTNFGRVDVQCAELMFVQDMLIALPNQQIYLPRQVQCFAPLVERVVGIARPVDSYMYLTAKRLFTSPTCRWNRPGWHIDGFGTDDINYIWSDSFPTEFCSQQFDLSDDHALSMIEMTQQVRKENVRTYGSGMLMGLDNTVVHQVAPVQDCGVRTFAKISISRNRYNLRGNAHNDLIEYDWQMVDRALERNDPAAEA